jgi:lipopolysaccharide transport system permease protein
MSSQRIIIEAGKSKQRYWSDLWAFKSLFYFLSWRDILVRYKQTVIGVAWSVIRPLLTILVFTVIFGNFAKMPDNGLPYVLIVCAGTLPWQFFSGAFSEASNSLIANAQMLGKVYFPRLIIPTSAVIVAIVDFLISFAIFIVLMLYHKVVPGIQILFLPLFFLQLVILALGSGYFISSLNVKYRDFRYIVPFIVQFGLYISPVGFTSSVVPERYQLLYYLNPMTGIIDAFRWTLLGDKCAMDWSYYSISLIVTIVIFIVGVSYFRKMEKSIADII